MQRYNGSEFRGAEVVLKMCSEGAEEMQRCRGAEGTGGAEVQVQAVQEGGGDAGGVGAVLGVVAGSIVADVQMLR